MQFENHGFRITPNCVRLDRPTRVSETPSCSRLDQPTRRTNWAKCVGCCTPNRVSATPMRPPVARHPTIQSLRSMKPDAVRISLRTRIRRSTDAACVVRENGEVNATSVELGARLLSPMVLRSDPLRPTMHSSNLWMRDGSGEHLPRHRSRTLLGRGPTPAVCPTSSRCFR